MTDPHIVTSTPNWTEIATALGQMGAAIFTAVTAYMAYKTIKETRSHTMSTIQEMRRQTEIMLKSLRVSYAPSMIIDWEVVPSLQVWDGRTDAEIHRDIFPEDATVIERINAPAKRDALELLSTWWKNPSRAALPDAKYLIMQLQNSQSSTRASSTATNIRANLKLRVPKRQGSPREEIFDYAITVPYCEPGNIACVPIKIEGLPWIEVEVTNLVYNSDGEETELTECGGKRKYISNNL